MAGWYSYIACPHCGEQAGAWMCSVSSGLGPPVYRCGSCSTEFQTGLTEWEAMTDAQRGWYVAVSAIYAATLALAFGAIVGEGVRFYQIGANGESGVWPWVHVGVGISAAIGIGVLQLLRVISSGWRTQEAAEKPVDSSLFRWDQYLQIKMIAPLFVLVGLTAWAQNWSKEQTAARQNPAVILGDDTSRVPAGAQNERGELIAITIDEEQLGPEKAKQALERVSKLPSLEKLSLYLDTLTNAHLEQIKDLRSLVLLHLRAKAKHNRIDDDGLAHLAQLKRLKSLQLSDAAITDRGLRMLVQLPELKYVDLQGTQITDDGLTLLALSPSIRQVLVHETKVTPQGVAKAKELRSDLSVVTDIGFLMPLFDFQPPAR